MEQDITVGEPDEDVWNGDLLNNHVLQSGHDRSKEGSAVEVGGELICTANAEIGCVTKPFGTVCEENGVDSRHECFERKESVQLDPLFEFGLCRLEL